MFETLEAAVADIKSGFASSIFNYEEYKGEHTFYVKKENIVSVCKSLKEKYGFNLLIDITGTDRFTDENRFEIVYQMRNLTKAWFLRIVTFVDESDLFVETVTGIWSGANWHEREAYDMVGVEFKNHPDMRRIYMPQEYAYFPMRKDYPLIGIEGSIPLPPKADSTEKS